MMSAIKRCISCQWFSRHPTDHQSGECHVDPPRSQGMTIGRRSDPPSELMWLWPSIASYHFCPKWEPNA